MKIILIIISFNYYVIRDKYIFFSVKKYFLHISLASTQWYIMNS